MVHRAWLSSRPNVGAPKAHYVGLDLEKALDSLEQIGDVPSIKDLLYMLQKCRATKSIALAKRLYSYICIHALHNDRSLCNHLVPLFVDCGSLQDAELVFFRSSYRNEHSWTSLILGYAQNHKLEYAFHLYHKMQENSVLPTCYTLVALLQSCATLENTKCGQEVHLEAVVKGYDSDLFVCSTLVDMYIKCGLIVDAQEAFNRMPNQDVVLWTTLISGYAQLGPFEDALKCFEKMKDKGIVPNSFTYSCVLKASGRMGALDEGKNVHRLIAYRGFEKDFFLCKSVVSMYVKCAALPEAWEIFVNFPVQDVVSWTSLLAGYAEHGPSEHALKCFKEMQLQGILPDAFTFSSVLKACGNAEAIENGLEIHKEIVHDGFEVDPVVGSALVSMYAVCGLFLEAQEVFHELRSRCIVAWNSLIGGFIEQGSAKDALDCFNKMQADGIFPDSFTFAHVLKACGILGSIENARFMHVETVFKGFEGVGFVGSTIVAMYAKLGLVTEAQVVFDQLETKEVVSWTALITGYTEHGPVEETLKCFERMKLCNIPLDDFTFASILKACGHMGAIHKGHEIHQEVLRKGFDIDLYVGTSLLYMYVKNGSCEEAQLMFRKLSVRDVAAWNTLISGFADHQGHLALKCFEEMQDDGVKPDSITFSCLLTACSHLNLVSKGREFFMMMIEDHGLTPSIDHYTCMIDLLARTGHLKDAIKYLESTPSPPSVETLRALLYACQLYGELELGSRCFLHHFCMDGEFPMPMADIDLDPDVWSRRITEMKDREEMQIELKGYESSSQIIQFTFREHI